MTRNVELATNSSNPDVIFLGDSITEHWLGTELGEEDPSEQDNAKVFQDIFINGNSIRGLALGIAGDRVRG
jgi:hypothetical protein